MNKLKRINILILSYILCRLKSKRKSMLDSKNMVEHTFILIEDFHIKKIDTVFMSKHEADIAIKGVMSWQKNKINQG